MTKRAKHSLLYTFILLLTALILSVTGVFAWYTNIFRIYTSDGSQQYANIGMRINLLFDRLNPATFAEGSTITYPDGTTATFDNDEPWGTEQNPYIISLPRHMINLYALQESGYFYDRYISQNYTNGAYNGGTSKPYFLVCETDATPACIDGTRNGQSIVIKPVGNDEYPFIGCVGGAQVALDENNQPTTATAPNGKTSISSIISNFTVEVTDDMTDIGLFGKIGYLGDENASTTVNGVETFNGSISGVSDLLLYDIKIVSAATTTGERDDDHLWEDDASPNVRYEEDHHVGILAGHIEYAAIKNISVYYTSDSVTAIDVHAGDGANYLSDSGIIGLVYNLNPETSGNSIGCATGTTIAGSAKGVGNEWGASIDMKTMFNRLRNVNAQTSSYPQTYVSAETVVIDEVEGTTTTTPTGYTSYGQISYDNNTNNVVYYQSEDGGSFVFGDRTDSYRTNYAMFHGKSERFFPKTVTTITKTAQTANGYKISDGTNYLCINNGHNAVTSATDPQSAPAWMFDNGNLYVYTDNGPYYLTGTTELAVSDAPSTTWRWDSANNYYYYTYNNVNYYLIYDNGWKVVEEYYYVITDGNGNYLTVTNVTTGYYATATLGNTTDPASASRWNFSTTTNGYPTGTISTTYNNQTVYLRYYNNNFTGYVGTNTGANYRTTWSNNGTSIYPSNNTSYYLRYNGTNWVVTTRGTYYAIRSGSDYLNITAVNGTTATLGTGTSVADISSTNGHTLWTFSTTGTNPSGTISATVNGTTYYLRDNNGTLTATTAANATSWSNNGSSLYNGQDYIEYSTDWHIKTVRKSIRSGNNYLNITAANGTTATLGTGNSIADNSESNHTMWAIDDNGYISASYNGTTYYLRNNNGTLTATNSTTNRTVWTQDGSAIYTGTDSNRYYLNYSGGWTLTQSTLLGYTIRSGSNYMNLTSTSTNTNNPFGTGTSVANTNDNGHTVWTFSNTGDNPSGTISATSGDTRYYIYIYRSGNMLNRQYNMRLSTSSNQNYSDWTNNNGQLYIYYGGNRYIRYNNGWSLSTTATTLSIDPVYSSSGISTLTVTSSAIPSVTVTSETEPAPYTQRVRIDTARTALTRTSATSQVITRDVTTEAGGYDTYFPLVADDTAPFAVNQKNTGYVVGGSHASYQHTSGDVRFSSYYRFNNYLTNGQYFLQASVNGQTYTSDNMEVLTRTYLSNGFKRIVDSYNAQNNSYYSTISGYTRVDADDLGLVKYDSARGQLDDMFMLQEDGTRLTRYNGSIYGVHFMDAAISMENMVTAPKVVINEQTYYNYQMPEDCIDFRLRTKGYINFFAGTYYVNSGKENNCFFSLNQIFRNDSNEITAIKRIAKIYGVPGDEKKPYIYLFGDGTYSSGSSSPANQNGYVEMFDTDWIERPQNIVERAMYYFEIPVNGGEYALGSVEKQGNESARYGAYLCYLDIGTSAATHTSMLGTIDFVYDNSPRGGNKIVVVPDTSLTDSSLDYYKPSLAIMYTKNEDENDEVDINNFTVKVTRTIPNASAQNQTPTLASTFGGSDAEHLNVVAQYTGGDTIVKVYPS